MAAFTDSEGASWVGEDEDYETTDATGVADLSLVPGGDEGSLYPPAPYTNSSFSSPPITGNTSLILRLQAAVAAPTITSISPSSGTTAGGTLARFEARASSRGDRHDWGRSEFGGSPL